MNKKPEVMHIPTPWKLSVYEGEIVADGVQVATATHGKGRRYQANAAFIMKAVNAHEGLMDFVKELRRWFLEGNSPRPDSLVAKDDLTWLQETERLIRRAEGAL